MSPTDFIEKETSRPSGYTPIPIPDPRDLTAILCPTFIPCGFGALNQFSKAIPPAS
jgi:hypothetical protein